MSLMCYVAGGTGRSVLLCIVLFCIAVEDWTEDRGDTLRRSNELESPVSSIKSYTAQTWYSKPWSELCSEEDNRALCTDDM